MTALETAAADELIGISTCSYCQKRYRILKKHERIVGKEIECPKCHRRFVVEIQSPTPIEQAAVEQAKEEAQPDAPPKRRRKKSEIVEACCGQIRDTLPGFMQRLKAIAADEKSSEEQIRIWCIDVLRSALGHEDCDLDTEMYALSQRIDVAIKHDGKVLLVLECKNARSKLSNSARDQAVQYAISKSADWAVVTNGQIWKLFRILPIRGHDPKVVQVFDVALFDDDGLSDYDVGCLYLLTKRALLQGDSDSVFHLQESLGDRRLLDAMMNERTIKLLKNLLSDSYKAEFDVTVKLNEEGVKERLQEIFQPDEL